MDKLLTVSIAAYNIEKFEELCLNSFVKPDVIEGIEVIVVSDGSKDRTVEIARSYEKKYPSVFRVIEKENGGWGSTVNAGIRAATGKYFKLLDGDDYYINGNLSKFIEKLGKTEADVVITPYITFDDISGEELDLVSFDKSIETERTYNISEVQDKILVAMHACAFKTEILRKNKIKITEKCFYTDVEYVLKGLNASETICFLDLPIYMYRLGLQGQSVSIQGLMKHHTDHLTVTNGLLDYEIKSLKEENKPLFRKRMQEMIDIQYMIFLNLQPTKEVIQDIKAFDKKIRTQFSHYDQSRSRRLSLARKSGYGSLALLYRLSTLLKGVVK